MIVLNLARGKSGIRMPLHLPASGSDIKRAFEQLHEAVGKGVTRIDSVAGPVPNLGNYLTHIDISDPDEREKLNTLAEKIDGMDESEQKMFGCVLDARSINGLDDILTAADALGDYIYHPQITTERELGVYLVENGLMDVPERLRPYLDYRAIGIEYHAEHSGAFTPDGYVVRRSEIPQEHQKEAVFRVLFWSRAMQEQKIEPYALDLPATSLKLEQARHGVGVSDFADAEIVQAECLIPELRPLLTMGSPGVQVLNSLAEQISRFRDSEDFNKFLAVLDVEQPDTLFDAYMLANSLDDYTLLPADTEVYAKDALIASFDVNEELLSELDGYMDYDTYGKRRIEEDGARLTEFGRLRREGNPFPTEEMGQQMM